MRRLVNFSNGVLCLKSAHRLADICDERCAMVYWSFSRISSWYLSKSYPCSIGRAVCAAHCAKTGKPWEGVAATERSYVIRCIYCMSGHSAITTPEIETLCVSGPWLRGSIRGQWPPNTPEILLCPEKCVFSIYNENKNLALLKKCFASPNLKNWLQAWCAALSLFSWMGRVDDILILSAS